MATTMTGIPILHCTTCELTHPTNRRHCTTCNRPSIFINNTGHCTACHLTESETTK